MTSVNITARKQVLAISGSIRQKLFQSSFTTGDPGTWWPNRMEVTIYPSVGALPHFDPGLEGDAAPAAVAALRSLLQQADGAIICTPEYAHGVPGSLKNAIDWMVGSGEFSQKPTVLITASTDGRSGHQALLETLRVLEAKDIDRFTAADPVHPDEGEQRGKDH